MRAAAKAELEEREDTLSDWLSDLADFCRAQGVAVDTGEIVEEALRRCSRAKPRTDGAREQHWANQAFQDLSEGGAGAETDAGRGVDVADDGHGTDVANGDGQTGSSSSSEDEDENFCPEEFDTTYVPPDGHLCNDDAIDMLARRFHEHLDVPVKPRAAFQGIMRGDVWPGDLQGAGIAMSQLPSATAALEACFAAPGAPRIKAVPLLKREVNCIPGRMPSVLEVIFLVGTFRASWDLLTEESLQVLQAYLLSLRDLVHGLWVARNKAYQGEALLRLNITQMGEIEALRKQGWALSIQHRDIQRTPYGLNGGRIVDGSMEVLVATWQKRDVDARVRPTPDFMHEVLLARYAPDDETTVLPVKSADLPRLHYDTSRAWGAEMLVKRGLRSNPMTPCGLRERYTGTERKAAGSRVMRHDAAQARAAPRREAATEPRLEQGAGNVSRPGRPGVPQTATGSVEASIRGGRVAPGGVSMGAVVGRTPAGLGSAGIGVGGSMGSTMGQWGSLGGMPGSAAGLILPLVANGGLEGPSGWMGRSVGGVGVVGAGPSMDGGVLQTTGQQVSTALGPGGGAGSAPAHGSVDDHGRPGDVLRLRGGSGEGDDEHIGVPPGHGFAAAVEADVPGAEGAWGRGAVGQVGGRREVEGPSNGDSQAPEEPVGPDMDGVAPSGGTGAPVRPWNVPDIEGLPHPVHADEGLCVDHRVNEELRTLVAKVIKLGVMSNGREAVRRGVVFYDRTARATLREAWLRKKVVRGVTKVRPDSRHWKVDVTYKAASNVVARRMYLGKPRRCRVLAKVMTVMGEHGGRHRSSHHTRRIARHLQARVRDDPPRPPQLLPRVGDGGLRRERDCQGRVVRARRPEARRERVPRRGAGGARRQRHRQHPRHPGPVARHPPRRERAAEVPDAPRQHRLHGGSQGRTQSPVGEVSPERGGEEPRARQQGALQERGGACNRAETGH